MVDSKIVSLDFSWSHLHVHFAFFHDIHILKFEDNFLPFGSLNLYSTHNFDNPKRREGSRDNPWLTRADSACYVLTLWNLGQYSRISQIIVMLRQQDTVPCFSGRLEQPCNPRKIWVRESARPVAITRALNSVSEAPSNGPVTSGNLEAPEELKHVERINPMTDRFEVCLL